MKLNNKKMSLVVDCTKWPDEIIRNYLYIIPSNIGWCRILPTGRLVEATDVTKEHNETSLPKLTYVKK